MLYTGGIHRLLELHIYGYKIQSINPWRVSPVETDNQVGRDISKCHLAVAEALECRKYGLHSDAQMKKAARYWNSELFMGFFVRFPACTRRF